MAGEGSSFWTTIPGILTALTGLVAAVGSLVVALHKAGVLGKRGGDAAEGEADAAPKAGPVAPAATPGGAEPGQGRAAVVLRSAPAVLTSAKVDAMLVRIDAYEARRNPGGRGVTHRWAARTIGDAVVVEDGATGLTWQKVASPEPMVLERAAAYVDDLSARGFAGFRDWRLPTAEEAMSLMEPEAVADFHIAPVFARGGAFIWTADRPSDGGGWVVYFYDGILVAESEAFNAWVRAVR